MSSDAQILEGIGEYKFGFRDEVKPFFKSGKGLDRGIVEQISAMKEEPQWMLEFPPARSGSFRKASHAYLGWRSCNLNLDEIYFYTKPTEKEGRSWDDVPDTIKETFNRLGIPEAEQKFLSGVGAQYESEMVYHSIQEHLAEQGVIFKSIEQGLKITQTCFASILGP
jgi:Fe-S cluster assembly protein SufB